MISYEEIHFQEKIAGMIDLTDEKRTEIFELTDDRTADGQRKTCSTDGWTTIGREGGRLVERTASQA